MRITRSKYTSKLKIIIDEANSICYRKYQVLYIFMVLSNVPQFIYAIL